MTTRPLHVDTPSPHGVVGGGGGGRLPTSAKEASRGTTLPTLATASGMRQTVFRTDRHGDVAMSTDGAWLWVWAGRDGG